MRANNKEDSETTPLTREGEVINKTKDVTGDDQSQDIRRKKTIKYSIIGGIVLIVVILAIVLPIVLLNKDKDTPPTPTEKPPTPPIPPGQNPYTVDPATINKSSQKFNGQLNFKDPNTMLLQETSRLQDSDPLGFNWDQSIKRDQYNQIAQTLNFTVEILDYKIARFEMTNATSTRFSIPSDVINKPGTNLAMNLDLLGFSYSLDPFSFSFCDVTNRSNILLSTEGQSLVMMDKFIQMDFLLPSQRLYGLGERVHEFQLGEGSWTMWAQGQDSPYDDGQGRKNLYGVHPFVLVQTSTPNDYIGIFFRNSAAQSPVVAFRPDGQTTLSYISIGGQLEVYMFIHGTAKEMIAQYQNLFGKPQLPPFWSLGWQQASWKYLNLSMVQEVIGNYSAANMPLEVIFFDIPYMDNYADFSVDEVAFPDLQDFTAQLKQNNQKLVIIVDAAISADDTTNKYYVQGNATNAFIQSSISTPGQNERPYEYGNNLISSVWPKKAVFMDWFNPSSSALWNLGLGDLYNKVNYDGLWLDMSEATTFVNGEINDFRTPQGEEVKSSRMLQESLSNGWFVSYDGQSAADTYNLPFVVVGSEPMYAGNWDNMTLSLNATHPGLNNEIEYNLHSLYGHMMARRTQEYLYSQNDNRQFLLTRSTFASSGRYTSHWLGDNWRDWNYLKYSIAGIMNMNMFGIPHVGADVCGFFGEKKDDEMCLSWIQLSTFYTLGRAHQNLTWKGNDSERSEPYLLDGAFRDEARIALYDRYAYLRMMYTCLFEANQFGATCFDPVFFHFPYDKNTYDNVESTFISSNAVLVAPVLQQLNGNTNYSAYLPAGTWVNLALLDEIIVSTGDSNVNLTARAKVNAYLKPGSLIPHQDNTDMLIKNTVQLLQAPINLVINRDTNGFAKGTLLLDTGSSRSEINNWKYEYYTIRHQANSLLFQITQGNLGTQNSVVGNILITNAQDLSNVNNVCVIGWDNEPLNVRPAPTQMVGSTLQLQFGQRIMFNQIKSIHYGNSDDPNYLNLCDPTTSTYYLNNDLDLSQSSVTANLTSMSGRPDLSVTLRVFDEGIVNVKWTYADPTGKRPVADLPSAFIDTTSRLTQPIPLMKYINASVNKGDVFRVDFKAMDPTDTVPLLSLTGMIYDEYLNRMELQLNTMTGANYTGIFGLGERAGPNFFYPDGVYTTYAKDQGTPDENGQQPTKGTYGVHPFMVYQHGQTSFAGIFNKVAQATDYWIKNDAVNGKISLKSVSIGGNGDLFVFIDRSSPESIVTQYYKLTGAPVLVPQWALGWNHCKWGYQSAQELVDNVNNYIKYQLPLDVQWTDIDYMNAYKDFTYDPDNFGNLPAVLDQIHGVGVKFVPIIDMGVAIRPGQNYTAYDDGVKKNVFLKIGDNNEDFIGNVWPNEAAFPDFFADNTVSWWQDQLSQMFINNIKFDGLWLDMNEIANFCDGVCRQTQAVSNPVQNKLMYIPGGINLESHAVSLDAKHANGQIELDTHSFQGSHEVLATSQWFVQQNRRPFIIERSSVAGMGKYGSRWLGDNVSIEKHMGYSVTGIMMMNMFGIPLAGSDICGFGGNTNAELCARWHVVGSYYPFSRNHNALGSTPQEPWVFTGDYEEGVSYLSIMKNAITTKYRLIRYYYTNLFMMSVLPDPKPFYKPVFFTFPQDRNTYTNITYNIMLGDSLKLSVLSDKLNQNTTTFYFPAGTWCQPLNPTAQCFISAGETVEWSSKAYDSYVHQVEGTIVPLQDAPAILKNSQDLQMLPVDFHVLGTLNDADTLSWSAAGDYINDNGVDLNTTGNFNQYRLTARRTGSQATEKITLQIIAVVNATLHQKLEDPNCYSVNENDYLGTVYFYIAARYVPSISYTVTAVDQNLQPLSFTGTATYDSGTDRIVFKPTSSVCLGSIFEYILVPSTN